MNNITLLLLLSLTTFKLYAGDETFPRTAILPLDIEVHTPVRVGIASNLVPCLGTSPTDPTFYHLSDENHISFVFAAQVFSPCPNQPGYGLQYDIGNLPAGDYTAQVYLVGSPNEIPSSIDELVLGSAFGDPLSFEVRGSISPVSVPSSNLIGLSIMIGVFLLGTLFFRSRKKFFLTSVLMFSVFNVQAKL